MKINELVFEMFKVDLNLAYPPIFIYANQYLVEAL